MTTIVNAMNLSGSLYGPEALSSGGVYASDSLLVGLEFELEELHYSDGDRFDVYDYYPEGYHIHGDASLRNGVEFVFDGPANGGNIATRINNISRYLSNVAFSTSERTSTHIHLNMRDGATVDSTRRLFTLVFMIEPAIFRFGDENRKWCSYCQPLTDMTQQRLGDILAGQDNSTFRNGAVGHQHQDKYYGLNLRSLDAHGTVEFRYFPGWVDSATTNKWINLVMELRLASESIPSIEELLTLGENPAALRERLAVLMPRSYPELCNLVEDAEIRRRALHLRGVIDVYRVEPAIVPSRLSAVRADSSMALLLQRLLNLNLTAQGRAVDTITELISGNTIPPDLVEDLNQVLRSSASHEFIRMFNEALAQRNI